MLGFGKVGTAPQVTVSASIELLVNVKVVHVQCGDGVEGQAVGIVQGQCGGEVHGQGAWVVHGQGGGVLG